jgi:hypothetical protein
MLHTQYPIFPLWCNLGAKFIAHPQIPRDKGQHSLLCTPHMLMRFHQKLHAMIDFLDSRLLFLGHQEVKQIKVCDDKDGLIHVQAAHAKQQ